MARKNDRRKPSPGVRKRAAKPADKTGARLAQPAPAPAVPKVKFRGRLLEQEPLARYTTYRLGGPARYLLQPLGHVVDVGRLQQVARRAAETIGRVAGQRLLQPADVDDVAK